MKNKKNVLKVKDLNKQELYFSTVKGILFKNDLRACKACKGCKGCRD